MAVAVSARRQVVSPAPRAEWERILRSDPEALVTQSPAWTDAMARVGYEDVSRRYALPSGCRAVVSLVRRRSVHPAALAPRHSAPPAWGMGGAVSDGPLSAEDLRWIVADLASQPALSVRIRPNPLHAEAWSVARAHGAVALPRLAHVIDLEGGPDAAWRRLSRSARWGVRKAQRSGVRIECAAGARLLPIYCRLLELSIERWARTQHEPLAAPCHANDLLLWTAMEEARAAGCRRYHLGESGVARSVAHFKERFGARAVPYAEYRFERLPLARADALARASVRRALRFRDA